MLKSTGLMRYSIRWRSLTLTQTIKKITVIQLCMHPLIEAMLTDVCLQSLRSENKNIEASIVVWRRCSALKGPFASGSIFKGNTLPFLRATTATDACGRNNEKPETTMGLCHSEWLLTRCVVVGCSTICWSSGANCLYRMSFCISYMPAELVEYFAGIGINLKGYYISVFYIFVDIIWSCE